MDLRKLAPLTATLCLVFGLAACESQPTKTTPTEPTTEQPTEPTAGGEKPKCECPASQQPDLPNDIVGETEYVRVVPGNAVLKARIDTGATSTSLTALDMTKFERDGKTWVKFFVPDGKDGKVEISRPVIGWVNIKRHGADPVKRPVVKMTLILGEREQSLKVNLTDRSTYTYPLLIGRNFLQGVMMVDVSKKYTHGIPAKGQASRRTN